jgi:hypothetical protein
MPRRIDDAAERRRRELAYKRAWYRKNQAKVRAQQARYTEERNAWKYQHKASSEKLVGHLAEELFGVNKKECSLTVISELELRFPSYRIGNLWERWNVMTTQNLNQRHAAERVKQIAQQTRETHDLAAKHQNERQSLELRQSKQRGESPQDFADAILSDDAADGLGTQDPPVR